MCIFPIQEETIMSTKQCHPIEVISLFCVSLSLFIWGVDTQEVIGFESRFYLFAREMWQNGISWFPTTYYQPYPDYPVSSTLLIYLFSIMMGGLTKLSAVMPSAIAAAMTVTMTYLIGAKESKRLGLYAVFFLLLTFGFVKSARFITLDMYPTLITTICFYFIYSSSNEKKSVPWQWISFLLLIGFAFRGPIGLVMPAGVVCVYYLLEKKWRTCFTIGFIALLLLILCTLSLLLLAYYQGGMLLLQDVLRMQVLGRMAHRLPFYFYLTHGVSNYVLSFPIALYMMFYLLFSRIRYKQNTHFMMQLIGWMVVILIGMSIPGDKKIRYILPITPAAALLSAYFFIMDTKEKYFIYLRCILQMFLLLLPIFFIMINWCFVYFKISFLEHLPILFFQFTFVLLSIQCVALVLFLFCRGKKSWRDVIVFVTATLSFTIMYRLILEPIELYHERAHALVTRVETLRADNKMQLVFYNESPDGLPIKYLINTRQLIMPIFIQSEAELVHYTSPAFFVTNDMYFANLAPAIAKQFHLVARGTLGHVPVIIFARNT
jgi:4-amino-4-deoxy-L-arabinose transferase-like glycosyltransferase